MALTPPENTVSAAAGDETGTDLKLEDSGWPPASATDPADATSGCVAGGAWTGEDSDAKGDLVVGAAAEVVDDGGGVSERERGAGISSEAGGCGDADNVFVEIGEPRAEAESADEPVQGSSPTADTGELKIVEEIRDVTSEFSLDDQSSAVERVARMNTGIVDVGGGKKDIVYSRRLRVESVQVHEEEPAANKRGKYLKSTMNGTANADKQPSENKHYPRKSLLKKKQGRSQKSAVESVEHVDNLLDENVQLEEYVSGAKRKRGTRQRHAGERTEHDDILYDEDVPIGQLVSSVQDTEHADFSGKKSMQAGGVPSLKHRGRPGRVLMEGSEHVSFFYPFQDETKRKFANNDLVWAKVRSHPWWPGQIFDASDASKLALDARKKGQHLVAYFGDKTFAWCDKSQLKPFQKCFAHLVKNCCIDTFVIGVNEALEEVSRRIELGMVCSCLNDNATTSLKEQKFENTGVREGTLNTMVDKSWIVNSFQPEKLVDYVRALARAPKKGADKLECAIANAQLNAFHRSKGYPERPVFVQGRGLQNEDQSSLTNESKSDKCVPHPTAPISPDFISGIKKPTGSGSCSVSLKDTEDSRKDMILFDLIEENADVDRFGKVKKASLHSSGRKRKVVGSSLADLDVSKIKRSEPVADMDIKSGTKQPKIGERICRIAGLLTGSPPMLKYNAETIKQCTSKVRLKKSSTHESHPKGERQDLGDEDVLHLSSEMTLAEIIARKRGKRKQS